MQTCSSEMPMVWRKSFSFSWLINEKEAQADTLWSELHVALENPAMCCIGTSFMDYSLHGYWEKHSDGGRRDSEKILHVEGETCKVSIPEVLCIIAQRKGVLFFLSFCVFSPFPPFLHGWFMHQPHCNLIAKGVHPRSSLILPVALYLSCFFLFLCALAKLFCFCTLPLFFLGFLCLPSICLLML